MTQSDFLRYRQIHLDFHTSEQIVGISSPLADNGGPTFTHALVSGSPAIDAIPDSTPADSPVSTSGGAAQRKPKPG